MTNDPTAVAVPPVRPPTAVPPAAPPPLFGERWPGPSAPPSGTVLGAVAVAGLAAALAVPHTGSGVGWTLLAVVIVGAGYRVARTARAAGSARPGRREIATGAAWTLDVVMLAGVGAVRDADWLGALCVWAACCAGALAVAAPWFRGLPMTLLALPLAAARAVPWLGRSTRDAGRGAARRAARIAVSALVGLGLLGVFGALLAGADAAFDRLLDDLLPTVDLGSAPRWIFLFGLGALGTAGVCHLLVAPPTRPAPRPRPTRLRLAEWALPVGSLVALFGLFVGVQFAALFGADDYVRRTTGLTYAEYARGGFWQLLTVTVLTLVVIAVAGRVAPEVTRTDRGGKRALLATLAVLTLVIVASALSRMWVYQQAYGFTVLRLFVLTVELWLGVGMLVAVGAVLTLRMPVLARGLAATGVVALLALAALDPERFVAEHNVTRFGDTGTIDLAYLSGLSADAVPALDRLPEPQRSCALTPIARRSAADTGWREWNAGAAAAGPILSAVRPATCAADGAGSAGR